MSNVTKGSLERLDGLALKLSSETTVDGVPINSGGGSVDWGDVENVPSPVSDLADGTTVAIIAQSDIEDISEAPTQSDFNGLLAALRAAGVLEA